MTGPDFSRNIYEMMGWKEGYRYKVLGYKIRHQGEYLYVFDLTIKETFEEKLKKRRKVAKNSSSVSDDTKSALDGIPQATPIQVNTRKGFYSDNIARNFGPSVDEYRKSMAVTETDSYVSYAALTGTSTPEAGSEDKESGNMQTEAPSWPANRPIEFAGRWSLTPSMPASLFFAMLRNMVPRVLLFFEMDRRSATSRSPVKTEMCRKIRKILRK